MVYEMLATAAEHVKVTATPLETCCGGGSGGSGVKRCRDEAVDATEHMDAAANKKICKVMCEKCDADGKHECTACKQRKPHDHFDARRGRAKKSLESMSQVSG